MCIVAGSDANFARLCKAMDRPDLLDDPAFDTLADRAARGDEINGIVAAWTRQRTAAEIEARCVADDVPVATAYTAADIFADPHMAARGDLVTVDDPVIGPRPPAGAVPAVRRRAAGRPVGGAPARRAHRRGVAGPGRALADEYAAYQDQGVI